MSSTPPGEEPPGEEPPGEEPPGEQPPGEQAPGERPRPAADAAAPDADPPRALVAGHGDFADGIISAVSQIGGRVGVFVGMTNAGMGATEIAESMRARLDESGIVVIFTDLPAGSMTIAARRLLRERPGLVLVTGANLATLLDFAFHADLPPTTAAQHAAEKGRASLTVSGGQGAAGGEGGGGG